MNGADAEFSPGVPGGAEVTAVESGSAADAAGIRAGDVITSVGGIPVGSWEALLAGV